MGRRGLAYPTAGAVLLDLCPTSPRSRASPPLNTPLTAHRWDVPTPTHVRNHRRRRPGHHHPPVTQMYLQQGEDSAPVQVVAAHTDTVTVPWHRPSGRW